MGKYGWGHTVILSDLHILLLNTHLHTFVQTTFKRLSPGALFLVSFLTWYKSSKENKMALTIFFQLIKKDPGIT